jgi:hypothetical protein
VAVAAQPSRSWQPLLTLSRQGYQTSANRPRLPDGSCVPAAMSAPCRQSVIVQRILRSIGGVHDRSEQFTTADRSCLESCFPSVAIRDCSPALASKLASSMCGPHLMPCPPRLVSAPM